MKKATLLALLIVSGSLAFAAPARADPLICVNDLCIDDSTIGGGSNCGSRHTSASGTWYYMLGTVRDLPVPGTFYVASWTASTYYEKSGSGCRETAYSCRVQVSDGSHFQYLRVGVASAANGEYKGIPTNGGTLTCGASSARLHTFAGLVLTLDGYGTKIV